MKERPSLVISFLLVCSIHTLYATTVTHIWPSAGSLNGETRLTIYGTGFAKDQFNFGSNSNLGNDVTLISDTQAYSCEIHKDGCTETQVMCFTSPMPRGTYKVRVKVDGTAVPDADHCAADVSKCEFKTHPWHTPTIQTISPRSGTPGGFIRIDGRIVSNRYGSNLDFSDNGLTEKFLRSYAGGQYCEIKNLATDEFYDFGLDSTTSKYGHYVCKMTGTYVGSINASFIIEGKFGRSNPALSVLTLSAANKIQMFQTYAVIDSISPSTGSIKGGTKLTVTGNYFDETLSSARITVGGATCENVAVTANIQTEMTCDVPEQPSTAGASSHTGNRGLLYESWTSTSKTFATVDDILSLTSSASDYNSSFIDETYFMDDSNISHVTRLTGYFTPSITGSYRFYIKCNDYAALYFSSVDRDPSAKTKIATCPQSSTKYSASSDQTSSEFSLETGKAYYLSILHGGHSSGAYVQVGVKMNTSPVTGDMTGAAVQEKQTVKITSDSVNEVQTLTPSNMDTSATAYTPEKQEVKVTNIGGNEAITYRLRILGASTGPLQADSDGTVVEAALNLLPMFANSITVAETTNANGKDFVITFDSSIGDLPLMEASIDTPGTTLEVAVTGQQNGVAGKASMYLEMDGVVAPAVAASATANEMKTSLEQLFGARCPSTFTASDNKYFEDFENPSSVTNMGVAESEIEAFCGRYSIKNPSYVYKAKENKLGISMSQHPWLCFAYNGPLDPKIKVEYMYSESGTTESATSDFSISASHTVNKWNYVCLDMMSAMQAAKTSGSSFETRKITINRDTTSEDDLYVDTVMVTRENLATDTQDGTLSQRIRPAMPGGFPMQAISVAESGGTYTVTMTPHNCSYDVPLIKLATGQSSASNLVTSTSSTSTLTVSGGSVTLATTRTSAASPPVTGSVDVSFEGNSVTVPTTASAQEVQDILSTIPNIGTINVTKTGDCANFNWAIKWLTRTGNLDPVVVDGTNLVGINAQAVQETNSNGGLWYDPIPGDLLRRAETVPQVMAYINDIPTHCSGNCGYQWLNSATPTVTSISPSSGTSGSTLVISGSGFSTTTSDNEVTIGGVACTVTAATASQLSCTVGDGSGTGQVAVKVAAKGLASGSQSFTYTSGVASVSPTQGSLGGGTKLTVLGSGFATDATVTVGTSTCDIQTQSFTKIVCLTAAGTAGTVDVHVNQYGTQLTKSSGFTYDGSITASISSASTSTSSVTGGGTLTLSGSGFGTQSSDTILKVGDKEATITSYSATSVVATLPAQGPGTYKVKLSTGTSGYAQYSGSGDLDITYKLKVTNIYPTSGSVYGGTVVTVTGEGFGTDKSLLEAKVGSHICTITGTVTDTQFKCQIAETGSLHTITNQGSSASHGVGYAWDHPSLNAQVGDNIKWKWWTSAQLAGKIKYGVYQTQDATSTTTATDGFSSGANKVSSGSYTYQVTSAGSKHYWSGVVDTTLGISLRGVLNVTERAQSVEDFSLKRSSFEAEYETSSAYTPVTAACELSTAISGCSVAPATGGTSGKFHFSFEQCKSGTVESISVNQGHSQQDVTMTGTGFADGLCSNSNEITVGDYTCKISAATASSITCRFDTSVSKPMPIAEMNPYMVNIKNRGYSILTMGDKAKRSFVLEPHISTYTPQQGSQSGGFVITISGGGFTSDTSVMIGSAACEVDSGTPITYDTIVCTAPSNTRAQDLEVIVTNQGSSLQAKCSDSTLSCTIGYSVYNSPTLTAVSPATVSSGSSNVMTLTGTQFGTQSSDVTVTIGGENCVVSSAADTQIVCTVGAVPVGTQAVSVLVGTLGKAKTSSPITVTSSAVLTSVSPASGSNSGGTLITLAGNGFVDKKTTVTVGGNPCANITATLTSVTCFTPAGSGTAAVEVVSDGTSYPTTSYSYDTALTPAVTSMTPTTGNTGDAVTITGTGFSNTASDVTVTIGTAACAVTSSTTTQIQCTLGASAAQSAASVVIEVSPNGKSASGTTFTYGLGLTSVSPTTGSLGGGQAMTVIGAGFSDTDTTVTVCGQTCTLDTAVTQSETQLVCKSPTATTPGACDVVVTQGGQTETLAGGYTYDSGLTPSITGVDPKYGGTGGGTLLTITGTGFGTNTADITVTIGGVACAVQSATNTEVTCTTGARSKGSINTKVALEIGSNGIANQVSADFSYYNVWSSAYSWGSAGKPEAGHFVVIPAGMTILLDETTPVLEMLLIQGGSVIFDEKDITLNANYILITDGGLLQVGTEAQPFQHQATIMMHGMFRSQELPIYGSKVLGVRNGTLDLHGRETPVTWTHLASTALAGDTTITLKQEVNWEVGNKIVIPTTGHRHTQEQTEIRTITAIAADKKTLTLNSALTYAHASVTETYGTTTVDLAGEVGLLTHNVVFRGSADPQWNTTIPACEAGFDTGEFTTQTCFQGRFGEEMGSDQFGGHILIHAPVPDIEAVIARISYIEVTHAGQAFRLGRYPIHFHLNGQMPSSYVRGCSIHDTFNRAVNIHGVHNITVEHNVLYDVLGGAFFMEDGIETFNIIQYNLGTFVRASSSLLNDDITPATFWITNPHNYVRHNAAAGGTHFGFWYRMHHHPDGPSYDPNICPQNVPLLQFQNNSAHSFGWFGIWIFQEMHPRKGGSCSASADHETAYFKSLTVWNCEKGAEYVNAGAIQFVDFVMVMNEKAGAEGKLVKDAPLYDAARSNGIRNSIIVANSPGLSAVPGSKATDCTIGGIVLPYGNGMIVHDIEFYNFDKSGCNAFTFTKIDGTCSFLCGGYQYSMKGISFNNSPKKARFDWKWQGVFKDEDGSLTGTAGQTVTTKNNNLPTGKCVDNTEFNTGNLASGVSFCDPTVKFHRYALNNPLPITLKAKDMILTNQYGSDHTFYAMKRITHTYGWIGLLVSGEKYNFTWENAEHVTNITYDAAFYLMDDPTDYIQICQQMSRKPDRFFPDGETERNESTSPLDISTNKNGDWTFDDNTNEMCYLVANKLSRRKKRGSGSMPIHEAVDRVFKTKAYKCYYTDCIAPPDPDKIPPTCTRASNATMWSNAATWSFAESGWGGNYGSGNFGPPREGDQILIPKGHWIVMDTTVPSFDKIIVQGTLELDHGPSKNNEFILNVTYLYIHGGRLIVGCDETTPFEGKASIVLRGDHSTPVYPVTEGPNVGSKVLGVFGGLDLHGKDVGVTWTKLMSTANAGASTITLRDPVTWSAGDEIVITATGFNPKEVEVLSIASIAADQVTITLNSTLQYKHIAHTETLSTSGKSITTAAEVGLLTRNIKIVGDYYDKMFSQSFGARVIVGVTADSTRKYTGYARVSNVEFYRAGQEGYTATYDPRHALSYLDIPDTNVKPRYVKKCSFHKNFGAAIGVYGTNNLEIQDNVIYHTVGPAIHTTSTDTKIRRNLISLMLWPGSYQDREQSQNIEYWGSIEALGTTGTVLDGNVISSSERIGYHGDLESCTATEPWSENEFHSNIIGLGIIDKDQPLSTPACWQYSNITAWKHVDFGLYYCEARSLYVKKFTSIDNTVGVFSIVAGPAALSHEVGDKRLVVEDSVFIGTSGGFDCEEDTMDTQDVNYKLSKQGRSFKIDGKGRTGITMGTFSSGGNGAPKMPLKGITSYNSIAGVTDIKSSVFAKFQTGKGTMCGQDVMISTPPANDDAIHPTRTQGLTLESTVDEDNKVYYSRPRLGTINPSDCVDMDCDGLKKALVVDMDGSLLGGSGGSVIPESEWEWNGDPRRGLGDDRIPKAMVTDTSGNKIPYSTLAPNKGVIRDSTCVYKSKWQAYHCTGLNYKMLMIESMDADTETSRLSPVALLGDGYLDLMNGPQDHGWCAGYTCQKRLSIFPSLVATGKSYQMYFTRNAPQSFKYHLLNAEKTEAIVVGSYHAKPNRLDVYLDGVYIVPENGQLDSDDNLQLSQPTTPGQYVPDVATSSCGANYLDRETDLLHIKVCGDSQILIETSPQIVIGFNVPSLTVDQFFGPNLMNNLATLLGISADKIRVMDVVTGVDRRRKRSVAGNGPNTVYYIEIGNKPCSTANCSSAVSSMPYSQQQSITVQLINEYQTGNLSDILNITINGVAVKEALPPTTDPTWALILAQTDYTKVVTIPDTMKIHTQPSPGHEGNAFTTQPVIQMMDSAGSHVTVLGASTAPWEVSVSLRAGSGSNIAATLIGNTTAQFIDGWANFTDLGISHSGSGYILDFEIIYPSTTNFTIPSLTLTVSQRPLKSKATTTSSSVYKGSNHEIKLDIRDETTDATLSDIAWSGLSWYANISMVTGTTYTGSYTSTSSVAFNPVTGLATFSDIAMDTVGIAHFKFNVYSSPAQYSFEVVKEVILLPAEYQTVTEDTSMSISMKFDADYSTYGNTQFGGMVVNHFQPLYPYTAMRDISVSQGSVVVTLTIAGNTSTVADLITGFCDAIQQGTSFSYGGTTFTMSTFLTVDGSTYYGVSCGDTSEDGISKKDLNAALIAGIIVLLLMLILAIIAVLVWRIKVYPKTKTHRTRDDVCYLGKGAFYFEDSFYRQDTFNSIRENSFLEEKQKAPVTTVFSPTKKQMALSGHY